MQEASPSQTRRSIERPEIPNYRRRSCTIPVPFSSAPVLSSIYSPPEETLPLPHLTIQHSVSPLSYNTIQIVAHLIIRTKNEKGSREDYKKLEETHFSLGTKEEEEKEKEAEIPTHLSKKNIKKLSIAQVDKLKLRDLTHLKKKCRSFSVVHLAIILDKFKKLKDEHYKYLKVETLLELPSLFLMEKLCRDKIFQSLPQKMREKLSHPRNAYLFLQALNDLRLSRHEAVDQKIFEIIPIDVFKRLNKLQGNLTLSKFSPPMPILEAMIEGDCFSYDDYDKYEDLFQDPLDLFNRLTNKQNFLPFFFNLSKIRAEGSSQLTLKEGYLTEAKRNRNFQFLNDFNSFKNLAKAASSVVQDLDFPTPYRFQTIEEEIKFAPEEGVLDPSKDPAEDGYFIKGNDFSCLGIGSLYPRAFNQEEEFVRQGDPVADVVQLTYLSGSKGQNAIIFCGADGSGWGNTSFLTANQACLSLEKHLLGKIQKGKGILHSSEAPALLLEGFDSALKALEEKELLMGTTLCGLLAYQSEKTTDWIISLCNLGDFKAYHFDKENKKLHSLLDDRLRKVNSYSKNPGGFLMSKTNTEIANLTLLHFLAKEGDSLILMTNGVHDNLRPKNLGISLSEALEYLKDKLSPPEAECLFEAPEDWVDNNVTCSLIEEFYMQRKLNDGFTKEVDKRHFVHDMIRFLFTITKKQREWHEKVAKTQIEDGTSISANDLQAMPPSEGFIGLTDHFGMAVINLKTKD